MSVEHSEHTAGTLIADDSAVSGSTDKTNTKGSLIAGLFAGITASACCAGPFVLLTLGVSGSWIGNLSKLEPFRPIFIGLALLFMGLAFRKLYWAPRACALDAPCATKLGDRNQKTVFWIVSVIVIASIAFPWYGPWLLDD